MTECTLTRTKGNQNFSNKETGKIATVLRDRQAPGVGGEGVGRVGLQALIPSGLFDPAHGGKGGSSVLQSGTSSRVRKALPESIPAGLERGGGVSAETEP